MVACTINLSLTGLPPVGTSLATEVYKPFGQSFICRSAASRARDIASGIKTRSELRVLASDAHRCFMIYMSGRTLYPLSGAFYL